MHPRVVMPSVPAATDSHAFASRAVKAAAVAEGFHLVGIASASPLDPRPLDHWLRNGWDAGLWYVRGSREKRLDVCDVLPGARSVVVVAVSYLQPEPERPPGQSGLVARYARGRDYHNILRRPLKRVARALETISPGSESYTSIDSRPVAEKAWAQRAGLGWIGKNGCLIAPPYGSYVVLGCIVTTAALAPDEPHPDRCGTCVACLSSCPTDAIPEPRFIDARKCIAYHTIEHRDPIPAPVADRLGGRIFGCDACQEVCPWNRQPEPAGGALTEGFLPRSEQTFVPLRWLVQASPEEITGKIQATPLARAGVDGLRRTARVLLGPGGGSD
jgi:epoxyqueuosine reductase